MGNRLIEQLKNIREKKNSIFMDIDYLVDFMTDPDKDPHETALRIDHIVNVENGLKSVYSRAATIDIVKDKLCNNILVSIKELNNSMNTLMFQCESYGNTLTDIVDRYVNNIDLTSLRHRVISYSKSEPAVKTMLVNLSKLESKLTLEYPNITNIKDLLIRYRNFILNVKQHISYKIQEDDDGIKEFRANEENNRQLIKVAGDPEFSATFPEDVFKIPNNDSGDETFFANFINNNENHKDSDTSEDVVDVIFTMCNEIEPALTSITYKCAYAVGNKHFIFDTNKNLVAEVTELINNNIVIPYSKGAITSEELKRTLKDANIIMERYIVDLYGVLNTLDRNLSVFSGLLYGVNKIYGALMEITGSVVMVNSKKPEVI